MRIKGLWFKLFAVLVPAAMVAAIACTPSEAQMLEGMLKNVDSVNGKITVVTKDGKTVDLTIDTKAPVSAAGEPSNMATLEPGAKVKVEIKIDGQVVKKIEALQDKVEGKVSAISGNDVTIMPEEGEAITLHVNDSTRIELEEDVAGKLADLKIGQEVEAKFDPDSKVAFKIELSVKEEREGRSEIRGMIKQIAGDKVTIESEAGLTRTVVVNDKTRIDFRGEGSAQGALADLKLGMEVKARFDPATMVASRIQVREEARLADKVGEIHGAIKEIAGDKVTIESEKGLMRTLTVGDQTFIHLTGDPPGKLADLKVGMAVEAKFDPTTMAASRIQLLAQGQLERDGDRGRGGTEREDRGDKSGGRGRG